MLTIPNSVVGIAGVRIDTSVHFDGADPTFKTSLSDWALVETSLAIFCCCAPCFWPIIDRGIVHGLCAGWHLPCFGKHTDTESEMELYYHYSPNPSPIRLKGGNELYRKYSAPGLQDLKQAHARSQYLWPVNNDYIMEDRTDAQYLGPMEGAPRRLS